MRDLAVDVALFVFVIAVCLYTGIARPSRPSEARGVLGFAIVAMLLPTVVLWIWYAIVSPGEFSVLRYLLFKYQPEIVNKGRLLLPFQYGLLLMAIIGWVRAKARFGRTNF